MKFKSLLLLLCLIAGQGMLAATEVTIGKLKYELNGTDATVSGYVGEVGDLVIPETITHDGATFNVTKVRYECFKGCKSITDLKTTSVKTFNNYCFSYCTNLKSVEILNGEIICMDAFYGCTSIKKIEIGEGMTSIGMSAFSDCSSFNYIVLPSTLTYLDSFRPFGGCSSLQSIIYLGKNLGKGGSNANVYEAKDFVTWSNSEFTYTGKAPNPSFTNNLPNGFTPNSYSISGLDKNAGTHTVNVPFTFSNSDQSFNVEIPYTYTIKKAQLTARVQDASRTYGNANPTFAATFSGFVNGENKSVLTSEGSFNCQATTSSDVGTYTITLTGASATNYDITTNNGTLTVTKASLSARPNDVSRTYGADNPSFTIAYTGLKNNESQPKWESAPTVSTSATRYSDVGQYDIVMSGGVAKNYDLKTSNGILTINKADLRVTANNESRQYYEDNPTFTCYYSGFVNNENESVLTQKPTISTTARKTSDAGTYPITISNGNAKNYRLEYVNGTLTINKRRLTVSTDNYTRTYNEENPNFKLIYTGFVNNETENVLQIKPKASTAATKTSDVGVYDIDISGGAAANYDFYYNGGTLTIEKAYQTLTWNQNLSDITRYDQVELKATATSGLEVSYYVDNTSICSVVTVGNKKYLDCFGEGETTIYAIQNGNKNYWQTTKIYKTISIKDPTGIDGVSTGNEKFSVGRNGITVNGLGANEKLQVFRLDGSTVYSGRDGEVTLAKGTYIVKIGSKKRKITIK